MKLNIKLKIKRKQIKPKYDFGLVTSEWFHTAMQHKLKQQSMCICEYLSIEACASNQTYIPVLPLIWPYTEPMLRTDDSQ